MNNVKKILLLLSILVVIIFLAYYQMSSARQRHESYHAALVKIMTQLNIGDSRLNVELLVGALQDTHIRLVKEARDEWIIKTPLEYGASNWILVVNFVGDKISLLRVRTEDSIANRPYDAPPDKK